MNALLHTLAVNSLRGGLLILAVLLLRLLLRRTPRRVICWLWSLAGLRLLIPIRLTSFFGLLPGGKTAVRTSADLNPAERIAVPSGISAAHQSGARSFDPISLLPWLWLTVAAGLLLFALVRTLRLRAGLSGAERRERGVWASERISTPFALGLLRPRIYLPNDLPQEDLPWVLAHERAHIRRGDICRKVLGFVLLTLYWFQPLCWLGWFFFCRDLELACDEAVTAGLPLAERKAYALALLRCSAPVNAFGAASFGEKPVSLRIRAVLRDRKQPRWLSALLGAACVLLILCLCFEAPASAQSPAPAETAAMSAVPTEPAGTEAPETVQSGTDLWTGENGSFAVSLQDALLVTNQEETGIRGESSGPMGTAGESEGKLQSVVSCNDSNLQLYLTSVRSSDGQDYVITMSTSGDIFGELRMDKSTEELSSPNGCTVSYKDAEGREIRWEIQTTP